MPNPFLFHAPVDQYAGHDVYTFVIDHEAPADQVEATRLLYDAIEFASRHLRNPLTTVVLDVRLPILPRFLQLAVQGLAGFGAGLVVLHAGRCSLDADNGLAPSLLHALDRAGRDGPIWHPLARDTVDLLDPQRFE